MLKINIILKKTINYCKIINIIVPIAHIFIFKKYSIIFEKFDEFDKFDNLKKKIPPPKFECF